MVTSKLRGGVWSSLALLLGFGLQGSAAEPPAPPAELRVSHLRAGKVLFLGNSITLHGPAEEIGWTGNWGMAASAEDKDFAHLLIARMRKATGGTPEVMVRNIADFERQFATYDVASGLKEALDFEADLVILAIGENVPALSTREARDDYRLAFRKLLSELRHHGRPTIFVRSCFWADATKDEIMAQGCRDVTGVFVDLGGLDKDERNFARSEREIKHAGVAGHPGDAGMKAIADALWKAIEETSKEKSAEPATP